MSNARSRRRAVDGLEKLPTTEQEWYDKIVAYGLADATLQDLCSYALAKGRFSASTVPKEAFLIVRCIWPAELPPRDALPYILHTGSFFNEEHAKQATQMLQDRDKYNPLGFSKLDTLFDVICDECKTPRQYQCSLAQELGPFSVLVSLKNQIMDKSPLTTGMDEPNLGDFAPRKKLYRDASQPSSSSAQLPDFSPTPRPKRARGEDRDTMDEDGTVQRYAPAPDIELADEIWDEIPAPRTPTETLVVDFMVSFLAGIACLLQPLSTRSVCVANAYETTYRFGPVRRGSDPAPPPADEIQFRARIDGSIPFCRPQPHNLTEVVIFEAKRAPRMPGQSYAAVKGQQSMEHVAYIWKKHEKDPTPRRPSTYHTFMIAQDFLSFYITIGTYDNKYLEYIFGLGATPVVLPTERKGFLQVQEFGPFEVSDRSHMEELRDIILCLMVWQLEGTKEGFIIREALS